MAVKKKDEKRLIPNCVIFVVLLVLTSPCASFLTRDSSFIVDRKFDGSSRISDNRRHCRDDAKSTKFNPHTFKAKISVTPRPLCVTTRLCLFFQSSNKDKSTGSTGDTAKDTERIQDELSSPNVQFPYVIKTPLLQSNNNNATLTLLRFLQERDVYNVTRMFCREYSTMPVPEIFPIFPPRLLADWNEWLDLIALGLLIYFTTRLKTVLPWKSPNDHAVIIISQSNSSSNNNDKNGSFCEKDGIDENIIGAVELSRQPVLPDRNPSPFPLPMWLKESVCRILNLREQSPQAYISNLLIAPEYRGQGFSKLLVCACEGLAKQWNLSSIHLHCDADAVSGRIPQLLYESLGYERETSLSSSTTIPFNFLLGGGRQIMPSVYEIEGVKLVYLKKSLK